jgi:hypothetical protein
MKTMLPYPLPVLMALMGMSLASCGGDPIPAEARRPAEQPGSVSVAERRAALRQQIDGMIADKSCSMNDQCKAQPLGYKACGGPDEYVVYSTQQTDSNALAAKAADYDAVDRQYDEQNGGVSDCRAIGPPQLGCQRGQCTPELRS